MKMIRKLRTSMAVNSIGAIVALLFVFGVIISVLGYVTFSITLNQEYAETTYHIADTAATLVNGDHLDAYLAGEETAEYRRTNTILHGYCDAIYVSALYVIQVDQSDYGRFVSIFDLVNNEVDNTEYTEWELGYKRDTTNDEYRRRYQEIYSQKVPYATIFRRRPTDGAHPHITTMAPVKNSAGEVVGILCVQRPMRELEDMRRPYALTVFLSMVVLAVIAAFLAYLYLKKNVFHPIRKVSDEATRFARENTRSEALGEIGRFHEITSLAGSIDTMEADMVRYMENLTTITAEKERIGTELSLASRIQEASLPSTFPAFPDRKEFDLYAVMDPAREVGGDFYNFLLIDDDHLALVIGDVSGKGVPAALFMMVTNLLISDRMAMGGMPGEILKAVNHGICQHNEAEMFVTIWLGVLEISTGKLTAANAGHEYPVLRRAGGAFELVKDRHGFVVGGMDGVNYKQYELQLAPGDRLFVYTDGVPEATNAEKQLLGTERMVAALNTAGEGSPEEILKAVRRAVDAFVLDAEQFDDLTMLCLEYRGPVA